MTKSRLLLRRGGLRSAILLAFSFFLIIANVWMPRASVHGQEPVIDDFTYWFNQEGDTGVLAGVQENSNIYVLEDMAAKGNTVEYTDGSVRYTVQGSVNPSPNKGAIPELGAAVRVTAPANGELTVYGINGAGKTFYVVNESTGEVLLEDASLTTVQQTLTVEAEEHYWFYSSGSKFQFAGFTFVQKEPHIPSDFSYWFNPDGSTAVAVGAQENPNIYALEDMAAKGNTLTHENGTVYYTVQGAGNPRTGSSGAKGTVPDSGAAMRVTAPADGALTVYGLNGAGKTFYVVNGTSGDVLVEDSSLTTVTMSLDVLAGNDYWFYSNGSKFQFAGFEFVEGGVAVEPDPTPTPIPEPVEGEDTGGEWVFKRFGASTNDSVNTIGDGADIQGSVTLNSASYLEDGTIDRKGGKFVADSPADGLSFYYRSYNPQTENFYLQADVTVDYLNPTPDGQEGFALMTRDSISGSGSYFSNLFSVTATKLPIDNVEIRDVIGVRNYTGIVNNENASLNQVLATRYGFDIDDSFIVQGETYRISLEKTSYAYISTQYNIRTGEVIGQHVHYINALDPSAQSVSSYAELQDPMTTQEANLAYLGLAVARGVNATFSNIQFETTPWQASEWIPQPENTVDVNLTINSPTETALAEYNLLFRANANGVADIYVNERLAVEGVPALANTVLNQVLTLDEGENTIEVVFTPEEGYKPDDYSVLSDYSPKSITHQVIRRSLTGTDLYVRQDGVATNSGTSYEDALDMQTALSYAKPGQRILVYPGVYDMSNKSLSLARGSGGNSEARIVVEADPSLGGYAEFDFGGTGTGFTNFGSYMTFRNLAFSYTAQGGKGMQVGGHHNLLENLIFYNNGSTGLQISGSSLDNPSDWPSYNTVRNSTSINNADQALEDADGFAPKLTTGPGNIFIGSIAAYNADDGWDLFAKAGTGSIGQVLIEDSLTYRNGYVLLDASSTVPAGLVETRWNQAGALSPQDGPLNMIFPEFIITPEGDLQLKGTLGLDVIVIRAGNGNGFKMGGTNMPGNHEIHNSIAYENRAKGFDSNSGPDIKVFNSTSYNNGSYNLAFYTNNRSATTDYQAEGFLSYRQVNETVPSVGEQLRTQNQDNALIYGENNYYWNRDLQVSENQAGEVVDDGWFVSLDTSITPSRRADGSIDMHGLLQLTEEARSYNSGARTGFWLYTEEVVEPTEPTEPEVEPSEPVVEPSEPTEPIVEPTEPTEPVVEPTESSVNEPEATEEPEYQDLKLPLHEDTPDRLKAEVYAQTSEDSKLIVEIIPIERDIPNRGVEAYEIKVYDSSGHSIHQTQAPLSFTMELAMQIDQQLVLYHDVNGDLEEIAIRVDGQTVHFETDRFSPYLFAMPLAEETSSTTSDDVVQTGESAINAIFASGLILLGASLILLKKKNA